MSEQLRERIYDLYAAYSKGKFDFVLNHFDERAEFTSYAPVEVFPYLGRRHGRAAIAETMNKIKLEFETIAFHPIFIVAGNEDAAAILLARLRQRATGRIIQLLLAHFLRLREGRIVELREFMDSFDAAQQVLGHQLKLT